MLQRKSLSWFGTPTGINNDPVDRFTPLHLSAGYVAARYLPFHAVAFGAVLFELLEDRAKQLHPEWFPHPSLDTKVNALFDIGAALAGAMLVGGDNE